MIEKLSLLQRPGGYLENSDRLIDMMEESLRKVIEMEEGAKTLKQSSWFHFLFWESSE